MTKICKALLWIVFAVCLPLSAQSDKSGSAAAASDSAVPCASAPLPDAPTPAEKTGGLPTPPAQGRVADWEFAEVTSALFEASIADAETLYRCDNCTAVRPAQHRRGVTYGVGLPVDVAVSYLTYRLKKKGHRWWFVPAVALTAANAYLSYHWASSTD